MTRRLVRRSRKWSLVAMVTTAGLIASACAAEDATEQEADDADTVVEDTDDVDEGDESTDDAEEAAEGLPPGTYAIGHEAVTSGPVAFAGVPLAQGARLAVDEINQTGFLGEEAELELMEQDTGGDPARGISAYERFVGDGAAGVLCCALSSAAEPIKNAAAESGVPAIVTSAVLPGLPEPPFMFRPVILLSEEAYGPQISDMAEAYDLDSAVMALTADNDGMVLDGDFWAEAAEDAGVEVIDRVDTRAGDTDFSGPATQIVNQDPDLVILSMLGEEATLLTLALRNRGYEGQIATSYGMSNEANYEIAGEAVDGVKFAIPYTPESPHERAQQFTELYREEYGETPDIFAAQGYTAVWMLAEGLVRSGDGEPENVGQALADLEGMDSVYGPLAFEDGQAFMESDPLYLEWQADGSHELWEP